MKDKIIKILNRYTEEMEGYSYFSSNPGISESDYEEIAEQIVKLIREEAKIWEIEYNEY